MYSKTKLREMVKEEAKTSKEYKQHGFPGLARDEAKHSAFFKMLLNKKGGKK